MEPLVGGYVGVVVLALIFAVAWIIMPFALLGTKPLLRELIKQTAETNALLRKQMGISAVEPPSALHDAAKKVGQFLAKH